MATARAHHAVNVSVLRRSVFSLERQRTHTVNAMQKADRVIGHLLKGQGLSTRPLRAALWVWHPPPSCPDAVHLLRFISDQSVEQ